MKLRDTQLLKQRDTFQQIPLIFLFLAHNVKDETHSKVDRSLSVVCEFLERLGYIFLMLDYNTFNSWTRDSPSFDFFDHYTLF